MNALKEECNHLARILFKLLAKALGVEEDFFYTQHLGMYSDAVPSQYTQRTLHYPPVPPNYEEIPGAIRCCEHTDYGTVTLLFQDETGGLEVRRNTNWKYNPIKWTHYLKTCLGSNGEQGMDSCSPHTGYDFDKRRRFVGTLVRWTIPGNCKLARQDRSAVENHVPWICSLIFANYFSPIASEFLMKRRSAESHVIA